jgi:hypothetical protein
MRNDALAEAEPFEPVTIVMQTGDKFQIRSGKDIEFTHYGSPKVRSSRKHGEFGELARHKRPTGGALRHGIRANAGAAHGPGDGA